MIISTEHISLAVQNPANAGPDPGNRKHPRVVWMIGDLFYITIYLLNQSPNF